MADVQPLSARSTPSTPLVDLMSRPVVALQAVESAASALATAQEQHVHHFPVYSRGQLIGVVCTCDLQNVPRDKPVGEVMRPAVTIVASRSSTDAAMLMKAADVGSVLVLDAGGRACGIVTRGDLDREGGARSILADVRCECCGTTRHLHRYEGRQLCESCRERAAEPQAFETGGGD